MGSPLARHIALEIEADGPMTLARYMALAVGHPEHGYYMTREPFGPSGDFTTAPEISQMFGEMLGLWAADYWTHMGRPDGIQVVELGPGRGTLMADALRAARSVPGLTEAARIHLVETSPRLRAVQERTLKGTSADIEWHSDFSGVPGGPVLLIANELFDALPFHQFEHRHGGWHERHVKLNDDGQLVPTLAPLPTLGITPDTSGEVADGAVCEVSPERTQLAAAIARRIVDQGGAAIIIDYGQATPALGDTFQAVRNHEYVDPFAAPGDADLTSHVNFAALARSAADEGAAVFGPVEMGSFLTRVGMSARCDALCAARPDKATKMRTAFGRLTESGQMGSLFKVLVLSHPAGPAPAPFPERELPRS